MDGKRGAVLMEGETAPDIHEVRSNPQFISGGSVYLQWAPHCCGAGFIKRRLRCRAREKELSIEEANQPFVRK